MRTHGTEITLASEPMQKKMLVEASVTYQQTEDRRYPDIDVAYSPNWLGYFKLAYKPKTNYSFCNII